MTAQSLGNVGFSQHPNLNGFRVSNTNPYDISPDYAIHSGVNGYVSFSGRGSFDLSFGFIANTKRKENFSKKVFGIVCSKRPT